MSYRICTCRVGAVARTWIAALVLLAPSACYFLPREEKVPVPPIMRAAPVRYDEVEARSGTIEDTVVVTGSFAFIDQTSLFFRSAGGRLKGVYVAAGDVVRAGALIADLETGVLESRIAQQKLLVRKAEIASEKAVLLGRDRLDQELARIDVELARMQLADLGAELDGSRLVAPRGGIVVYRLAARPGQQIEAYSSVVEIADPARLQLVYTGDRASEFGSGMDVAVRIGVSVRPGTVAMAPRTTPADALADLRSSVVVRVPDLPPGVANGDYATITLTRARKEGAVILPRSVVKSYLGRYYVQLLRDGVKQDRTVDLGITGGTDVEILSGVSAGEKVLAQ